MEKYTELFESLGLTAGESKVYYNLLIEGSSKISEIVKKTEVSSSKIYFVIEKLMAKGLVSYITYDNQKIYTANEPYRLMELIKEKEDDLKQSRLDLEGFLEHIAEGRLKQESTSAEIFIGMKGIRTAYQVLAEGATKEDTMYFMFPYTETSSYSTEFYDKFYETPFVKPKMKGILQKEYVKNSNMTDLSPENVRIADFPLPVAIDMVSNKLLLIAWSSNPTGILIESKDMANNFMAFFNYVWEKGISPDKIDLSK